MRIYQRIFLVAVLTIVLVAAAVGSIRHYLLPLAEQAAAKPNPPDEIADDLPSACLDELAALENSTRQSEPTVRAGAFADSPQTSRGSALAASRASEADTERDGSPGQAPDGTPPDSDVAARHIGSSNANGTPIGGLQAVTATSATVAATQSARSVTFPVTVEEPLPSESLDSLRAADVLDLMRRLRSDDDSSRSAGRRELVRRGFSEVDLELARQLFSPDVTARKQLALAVPRLASVDAARWLMWLAADPQPEVRIAAIATLATTGDPALLDRVEALARRDSDPQVQALADQIAKQRDLSASRGANPLR